MTDQDRPTGRMGDRGAGETVPQGAIGNGPGGGDMPAGSMTGATGGPAGAPGQGERVLIEMRVRRGEGAVAGLRAAQTLSVPSLALDLDYEPVPMSRPTGDARGAAPAEETAIVRGTIDPRQIPALKADPNVVRVWMDGPIALFATETEQTQEFRTGSYGGEAGPRLVLREGMAPCPIGTCDCKSDAPKGSIADVASYLGVDQIWAMGFRGDGIVVGVVDGGIRAAGRPIKAEELGKPTVDNVIGGWPVASWGTTAAASDDHGNMTSTDVLGMAPNARIYDLRVTTELDSTVSNALQAYQWAINQHKADGTPHILTNSWGMFQKDWDPDYCTNPNHPFTRKVVEAIDEGILVLFAAGNCGATCPADRCGTDTGPSKSIWGANGHPDVITVGAVNKNEQFVGYSSVGPAALDPNKPDFCSITHFTGYTNSDSGTSAATPIAAGVVALLKQKTSALTQAEAKALLRSTAKDIGPTGFDQFSGAGIIRAKAAFDALRSAHLVYLLPLSLAAGE